MAEDEKSNGNATKAGDKPNVRPGKGGIVPPIEHRFGPNNPGNPGGKRKGTQSAAQVLRAFAERRWLPREIATMAKGRELTMLEKSMLALLRKAITGSPAQLAMLLDRLDGKVPAPVEVSSGPIRVELVFAPPGSMNIEDDDE